MLSLLLSTVAFFVAGFFLRRYLDEIGVRRSMSRSLVVFIAAILIAYGVAFLVDAVTSSF